MTAGARDRKESRAGSKALLLGFVSVALAAAAVSQFRAVSIVDNWLFDAQSRRLQGSQRIAPDPVAVVGIDEDALSRYPEPLTLWHAHLGKFFRAMALARPAAIAVDINLPDRSFDFLVPGLDHELAGGLLSLRGIAPVFLAVTVEADGRPRKIHPLFLSMAGADSGCYSLWKTDDDLVVRRFDDRLGSAGEPVATLAGCAAKALGRTPGRGFINYAAGAPFDYVPLGRVIDDLEHGDSAALASRFQGKVVLLGSVISFVDRHYQPVPLARWEPGERNVPGMLIHAQALRSILGPGLIRPANPWLVAILWSFALTLWWISSRPLAGLAAFGGYAAAAVIVSTLYYKNGVRLEVTAAIVGAAFASGGRALFDTTRRLRERRRLRHLYAYVSPNVMSRILAGEINPAPGGERRRIAVLFSDIRGFTGRSESIPPEEIITLLNRYFEEMGSAIAEYDGTLDKFIGDGIMAFFGAPNPLADPEARAWGAARSMLRRLEVLNRRLVLEGLAPIRIGVGLHVGDAIVGHVGSRQQFSFTAIGDVVNLTSRLEGMSKEVGKTVIATEEFVGALGPDSPFLPLGVQPIRGHAPVSIFGWSPEPSTEPESGKDQPS